MTYRLTDADVQHATRLTTLGFAGMDALHLACAAGCGADVLLTTDDKLLRLARRQVAQLHVAVDNPLHWLLQQQEEV